MSGTLIPTMAHGIDPTAAFGAYNQMLKTGAEVPLTVAQTGKTQAEKGLVEAQTGETKARTGLIGAQTTGADIANQMAGLNLGLTKGIYGQIEQGGSWQQPGSLPWDSEGGGGARGADVATGSVTPSYGPSAGGAIGGGGGGGGQIGGSAPSVPQSPPGGLLRGGPSTTPFTGPGGRMLPSGIAVPVEDFLGWAQAQDKTKAMQQIIANKNIRLSQLVSSTIDPQTGRPDPQAWNAAVKQAFYGGLIDSVQAARFYNHPDVMGSVQAATLAPNEQPGVRQQQAQATAAGTGAGGAPYELVDVPVQGADGTVTTVKMTRADALRRGQSGGQTGAQLATPAAPITGQEWSNRVQGRENPGGNPAQLNTSGPGGTPTSSAAGNHQWINETWSTVLARHRPDLVANKTPEQIQALRFDPTLSAQMAQEYAKDNAGELARQNLPINSATLGLAHGFGPAGAAKILSAPAAEPLTQLFPPDAEGRPNPVIAANPTYARHTVGSMVGQFVQQFGTGPVDFSNAGGAAPALPAGTIGAGAPQYTPQQNLRIEADRDQIKEDNPNVTAAQTGAMHASSAMPVLLSVRDLAARIPTGSFGEARTGIANFLQTFSPEWANRFVAAVSNIDPSKAGAMQEFVKQTFQTVTSAESQLAGARIGARLTEFFSKAMPNINMQGDAVRDMVNFLLIGNQMVKDYGNGASTHYNASRDAFLEDPVHNRFQPLSKYDQSWLAADGVHAPAVYEAAAMALNRRPFSEWGKGLSPAQKHAVIDTIRAADPQQGGAFNGRGAWVPVGSFPPAGAAPRVAEPAMAGG